MIWLQIILFSIIAGIVLFLIHKVDRKKSTIPYYIIFTLIFSILIATAIGFQARIDTSNIIFSYILPSTVFSITLCIEAIIVSIAIKNYTNIKSMLLYLPTFILLLLIIYFLTMTVLVSIYPGS